MSWTAALLASALLVGGAWTVAALRRRNTTHVLVNGRWVMGARIARETETTPSISDRLRRWWLERSAASFVHGEWRREVKVTAVHLERRAGTRAVVRVENAYEIDLLRPTRPLSQLRLQVQLTAVALSAVMAALIAGRARPASQLPPHDAYAPGGPAGIGVMPARWFMGSLATPSPHPFRTSTAASTPAATLSPINIVPVPPGHTNTALVPHNNAVTHTNAITAHTNIDSRPIAGPF